MVVRKQQDQYHRDVLLYKTLSSGCWKTTSTIEQTPWQRCALAVTREWWDEWADITSVEELPSEDLSQPSQEYLHSSHLPSLFVPNPALQQTEQETVHQCIQACQSSPLRDILAWHFPPCFSRGLLFSCSTLQWSHYWKLLQIYADVWRQLIYQTLSTGAAVFLLHTAIKSLLETTSNICWYMKTVNLPNTFFPL